MIRTYRSRHFQTNFPVSYNIVAHVPSDCWTVCALETAEKRQPRINVYEHVCKPIIK